MNWLWGTTRELVEEKPQVTVNIVDSIQKLRLCTEQQAQPVRTLLEEIRNVLVADISLLTREDEELGKTLTRKCIWACNQFPQAAVILRPAIEIISIAISPPKSNDNRVYLHLVNSEVLFETETPSGNPENNPMNTVLKLLSHVDFYTRYYSAITLSNLVKNNKTHQLQASILSNPMAVATIVDLLEDEQEVLRFLALSTLLTLTESNQELQKLIAFSGAFDKAFDIISSASQWGDEAIASLNSLKLIKNLLKKNFLNQTYFRECGFIPKLKLLLELGSSDTWILTDQKINLVIGALDIIMYLISGISNPGIFENQTQMAKYQIQALVTIWALDRINSVAVRSKALRVLGALLRNHPANRVSFGKHAIRIAGEKIPQPTLHRVLTLGFHSPHLSEQLGALSCFENFIRENTDSQLALVSTLTPPPDSSESTSVADAYAGANSIGRQLIHGISVGSQNKLLSWIASCMLGVILADNQDCKQAALRIPLSFEKQETLLSLCLGILRKNLSVPVGADPTGVNSLSSIGIVRLLCLWMHQSGSVVSAFLKNPENLPFLVDIILQPEENPHLQGICALLLGFCFVFNHEDSNHSTSRLALHGIICHRIGLDKFLIKLEQLRKSSGFISAEQFEFDDPQNELSAQNSTKDAVFSTSDLYDLDFCEFFKKAYEQVVSDLKSPNKRAEQVTADLIKEKDKIIQSLQSRISELEGSTKTIQQEEVPTSSNVSVEESGAFSIALEQANLRIQELEAELVQKEEDLSSLSMAYNDIESILQSKQGASSGESDSKLRAEIAKLTAQNDEYSATIVSLRNELQQLKLASERDPSSSNVASADFEKLQSDYQLLLQENQALKSKQETFFQLQEANSKLSLDHQLLTRQVSLLQSQLALKSSASPAINQVDPAKLALETQLKELQAKYDELEQSHEELLILYAHEEINNAHLQDRLKSLEPA